ncbi:MAG TPA: glutamate racemase [Longimicrobiales bacterium]|nr:glutamate racemase [Longimicrobiales bacterium]
MREAHTPGRESAIGVFDSGIGGLTVVDEIRKRLPAESIVYFGDTARVPYGPKSPETVLHYSREAMAYLLEREVKAIVVACNTATAHAHEVLRGELGIPVIGVIEPGARAAAAATRTGRIGVIGTAGTIRSGAYDRAVRRLVGDRARVYAQPCPLFVPLVEEGLVEHPAARLIAAEYLAPLQKMDVDVLVLGCTHYPLLRPLLAEVMGPDVRLVDSAAETAIEVDRVLSEMDLVRNGGGPPSSEFAVSDMPLRFREVGRRFVGDLIGSVRHIDIESYGRSDS